MCFLDFSSAHLSVDSDSPWWIMAVDAMSIIMDGFINMHYVSKMVKVTAIRSYARPFEKYSSIEKRCALSKTLLRILTNSSSSAQCSSQMTRAPKRSEEGLILPIPHSRILNPVIVHGGKYWCVQRAESTKQWHA